MSLLSSLFKSSKKPNMTPDITPPDFNQSQFTVPLGKLAQQRIQAGTTGLDMPGVGFGEDFVNKSTNPIADQMRRNFKQETLPSLSSQASARGIGHSNLALKTIGQQESNVEGDINALMAKFYTLNEAQKKSDIFEGIGLGQQQQGAELEQKNVQANASERLANATAANSMQRQSVDQANAGRIVGALMNTLVPGSGTTFSNTTGTQPTSTSPVSNSSGSSGVKTQLLGSLDPSQVDAMSIEQLLALFGG